MQRPLPLAKMLRAVALATVAAALLVVLGSAQEEPEPRCATPRLQYCLMHLFSCARVARILRWAPLRLPQAGLGSPRSTNHQHALPRTHIHSVSDFNVANFNVSMSSTSSVLPPETTECESLCVE